MSKKQTAKFDNTIEEIGNSILKNLGDIKDIKTNAEEYMVDEVALLNQQIKSIENITTKTTASFDDIATKLEEVNELIRNSVSVIEQLTESIKSNSSANNPKTSNNLKESGNSINGLNSSIQRFSEIIKQTGEQAQSTISQLQESTQTIKNSTDTVSSDISNVYDELTDQIKKIAPKVNGNE